MSELDFNLILRSQEQLNLYASEILRNLQQSNKILIVILIFVAANLGAQLIRNLRK